MKALTKTQTGELFLVSHALMWSIFPVITTFTFNGLTPLFSAGLSTCISALFFGIFITFKRGWHELNIRSAWKDILLTSLFIGIGFYALLFIGIQKTTAGNAGILTQLEVLFSMIILGLWKKEKLKKGHIGGAVLMIIGGILVVYKGEFELNAGDLIIIAATALPPIGNYFAQKARQKVSSSFIMFSRSVISGIFLMILAILFEPTLNTGNLKNSILFVVINGIFLLGLAKILWIESIHRISISKAVALDAIAPAFTLIFAYWLLNETPTGWQILGFIPILIGVWILTDFKPKSVMDDLKK